MSAILKVHIAMYHSDRMSSAIFEFQYIELPEIVINELLHTNEKCIIAVLKIFDTVYLAI